MNKEVWIFYIIKNNEVSEVKRMVCVKPERTNTWKNLQKMISQVDKIGFVRNEYFHEVIA